MRLWSLHPSLLDQKGLVALWREALLAKSVLMDKTRGYKNHPQLDRFKASPNPVAEINEYLSHVSEEASRRGYRFDSSKIDSTLIEYTTLPQITVTHGQIMYEWKHLLSKVSARDPKWYETIKDMTPDVFPDFIVSDNPDIEPWERV
jgi:hypothetical protein